MSRARRDLLARLRALDEATTVETLARISRQHPNTVREHLEALVDSGEVQRVAAAAPAGRGRPARLYLAADRPVAPAAAATLASVLAAQLSTRPDARSEGISAGKAWAGVLRGGGGHPAPEDPQPTPAAVRGRIASTLTRTGFATEEDAADPTMLRLTRCPLLEAARDNPDVVCSVHLGLIQGLLEDAGDTTTSVRLLPFAADNACLLHLGAGAER